MKLSDSQARKLGEELAKVIYFEGERPTLPANLEALGNRLCKLCTPYVLEAIREPSEEMIDAGVGYDEWFERSDARGVWQAMIDVLIEQHKR